MAHFWGQTQQGHWRRRPLAGREVPLRAALAQLRRAVSSCKEKEAAGIRDDGPAQELAAAAAAQDAGEVLVRRTSVEGKEVWVLLCAPQARVRHNGTAVDLGLCVLVDHDELLLLEIDGSHRCYFSTEHVARIEPAPAEVTLTCPRCKSIIEAGSPAVCCGGCGAWHHQRDDRGCWLYTRLCAGCHRQATSLDGQPTWSPAHL